MGRGWIDRNQVWLYLAGLIVGAMIRLAVPQVASTAQIAMQPVLGLLLFATFVGIPLNRFGYGLEFRRRCDRGFRAVQIRSTPPGLTGRGAICAPDPVH